MSRFDMDEPTFLSIWAEIKRVVVELEKNLLPSEKSISPSTSYENEMGKLETEPLDPEMEQFYKKKIEEQEKAFHEEQETADHVRRNILANTRSRISQHSFNSYVETKAVQAIIDQLKSKSIVIVAGCPGSGKTTTVLEVMSNLVNESNVSYTPVILDNPEHWDQVVNISERMVIFLDNPMGKSNFDRLNFVKWEKQFENMISCPTNGNCFIIIAIRDIVLQEMIHACRPNRLFTQRNTINISVGDFALDNNEKLQIITQYQITNKRELSVNDKSLISKSQPYYGFPQTCFLFFTNQSLFELGVSFFSRPDKTLVNEIEKLRKSDKRTKKLKYYILVYVLIYKTINLLCNAENVVAKIGILAKLREVEVLEIKDIIEELEDIYVISKEDTKHEFIFRHQTIKEAVLISYFKVNPKLIIKNCSLADLGELIRTETHPTKDQEVVLIIAEPEYQDIVNRFISFDPSCVELLECCVFNEWIGILEILFLKDNTLINRTDDYGVTLVTYAALWKRQELVKYLYDRKANVKHANKFGSCLHFCVLNEWTYLLDIVFADDPTLVNHTNANNMTLIEYAAKHNKKDVALYMYKNKAIIINVLQTNSLFLKYCVDNNWHDILYVILKEDKEIVNVKVTYSHSILTYAASQKKSKIVNEMIDVIGNEVNRSKLSSLLQICVDNDWFEQLNVLLKKWYNILNIRNKDGISLICYAAQWNKKRMVEYIFKNGAQPNSIPFLESCIENEWYDILETVITDAPSLVNFNMGEKGFTLICYAASENNINVIDILLKHSANINSSMFWNICVDNELTDVIGRVLTKQPALVHFINSEGETLICYAARTNKRGIVFMLLEYKALMNQGDINCNSFIKMCLKNKWNDILDIVFKKELIQIDMNGVFGSTLFAFDTSEEMVVFLYKYIPRDKLSGEHVKMLFQNFVLQERFHALKLLLLDHQHFSFDNVLNFFEQLPPYKPLMDGKIMPSYGYGIYIQTHNIEHIKLPDDVIYKVLCIHQTLVTDEIASSMFRFYLDKRPNIIIKYMQNHPNVCNLYIDNELVILNAARKGNKTIVSDLIYPWARDMGTTNPNMVQLMRYCIGNNWVDIFQILMNIEQTCKPFLADSGSSRSGISLFLYAVSNGDKQLMIFLFDNLDFPYFLDIDIRNVFKRCIENEWGDIIQNVLIGAAHKENNSGLVRNLLETITMFEDTDNIFNFLKEMMDSREFTVLSTMLQYQVKPEYIRNSAGESLFIHATQCDNKPMVACLVENIDFKCYLGADMNIVLKKCIENDWGDIFQTMLIRAANKGSRYLVNTLLETLNMLDGTDSIWGTDYIFNRMKALLDNRKFMVLSAILHYQCRPEYIRNIAEESLFLHATIRDNKSMVAFLVENIDFKFYLSIDIQHVLKKCIDNDWNDIIQNLFSKANKQLTKHNLGEIVDYAVAKNKKELIVPLLEYETDELNSLIIKHSIDNELCDVLQKCLKEETKQSLNAIVFDGMYFVNFAACSGKKAIMEQLYLNHKVDVGHFDHTGHTPLHYCIAYGFTVSKIILNIPGLLFRTNYGIECIHIAAFFGRLSIVKMLRQTNETVLKKTSYGCNAFQMALLGLRYVSHNPLTCRYLEKGNNFVMDIYEQTLMQLKSYDSHLNDDYETLLTYMTLQTHFEVNDLDIPMDQYGNSIIQYLVINNNDSLVHWVLERKDKLAFVKNVTELPSVLHTAAYLGRSNLFKTFLDCGVHDICANDSLTDAVREGSKFAGQCVYNSISGWINQDRIFQYGIKIKAVKYVEFQFGKEEEFDEILESLSCPL